MPFDYPTTAHVRRHGPAGYRSYEAYKPWLRDEFDFQCIYCLTRETHYPNGQDAFSVEHITPRSVDPSRECDYENLAYACARCNSYRGAAWPWPDPCEVPYGDHLRLCEDGRIEGLTATGIEIVRILRLNHADLLAARRHVLELFRLVAPSSSPSGREILGRICGFPRELPDLGAKRPPGGNSRPEGIDQCYRRRSERGALPETY